MNRRTVVALALLTAGIAAPAHAQFVRSGGQTTTTCAPAIAICDLNWSVTWFRTTGALVGSYANAPIVTSIPGPWAPNQAGVQQWIGAANNGTVGGGATRYYFQTTFTQAIAGVVSFGLGWDNLLVGAYVGGTIDLGTGLFVGGTSLLPGVSPATPFTANGKTAGFCRDGDGVFPGSQFPNCVLNVALQLNANQANTLTFVIEGDSSTDGLLVGTAVGANDPPVVQVPPPTTPPIHAVPEPSTVAMLFAGLLGLVGVRRHTRRA